MIVTNSKQAKEAAESIESSLGQPISTASHFYTLYYLTQQEDVDELEFDFFKLKDSLADDFLNYATAVTAEELHYISDNFEVKVSVNGKKEIPPIKYGNIWRSTSRLAEKITPESRDRRKALAVREATKELMEREAESKLSEDAAEIVYQIAFDNPLEKEYGTYESLVGEMIRRAISNTGAFIDNEAFLDAAQFLFGNEWLEAKGHPIDGMDATLYFYGWERNFGGNAWANVAETAKYYYEMSDEAFIDLMFSVEHNNGNFLNKTESEYQEDIKNLEISDRVKGKRLHALSPSAFVKHILPLYLDLAKEGDISPLYDIAISVDPQLRGYETLIPEQKKVPVVSGDPDDTLMKLVPVEEAGVGEWTKSW